MTEVVAATDDVLLERYLEGNGLEDEDFRNGLTRAVDDRGILPALCGAAKNGIGTEAVLDGLVDFAEDIYFHQVVARSEGGELTRYRDLPDALAAAARGETAGVTEWRIHFHVPLHCPPCSLFDTTSNQLKAAIGVLGAEPTICSHIEMETYTWEVLPSEMKQRDVADQLVGEYRWTLAQLAEHGVLPVD